MIIMLYVDKFALVYVESHSSASASERIENA
jgi:hypothetical protein